MVWVSGVLYPKEHKFDFQYKLLSSLPENYEDESCLIEYYLEASIKSLEEVIEVRKDFFITNPLDLNDVIIPDVTVGDILSSNRRSAQYTNDVCA